MQKKLSTNIVEKYNQFGRSLSFFAEFLQISELPGTISMLLSQALEMGLYFSTLFQLNIKPYLGSTMFLDLLTQELIFFVSFSVFLQANMLRFSAHIIKKMLFKIFTIKHNFRFNERKFKNLQNPV